jgi:circadian clock protein KaiB
MPNYVLKLFVAGTTARSSRAVANLRRLSDEMLRDQCEISVVDVLEQPNIADEQRVLVTPTLVRELPLPSRRVVGDLSDLDQVMAGLDLHPGALYGSATNER